VVPYIDQEPLNDTAREREGRVERTNEASIDIGGLAFEQPGVIAIGAGVPCESRIQRSPFRNTGAATTGERRSSGPGSIGFFSEASSRIVSI
jgi:hypothetical protein